MKKKYDFSGYATRNNIRCSDGRTIIKDAFKHMDGARVPLVWGHKHDSPEMILGHAILENREDGVYTYGSFNKTPAGQNSKELVHNGDIIALSIYANKLQQNGNSVIHGDIREVSLVLTGANPGAKIDNLTIYHSDEDYEELIEDEAIIHSGSIIDLKKEEPEEPEEDDKILEHEGDEMKTLQEIFDAMSEEQKQVVYALVGMAAQQNPKDFEHGEDLDLMKINVFENDLGGDVLSHEDISNQQYDIIMTAQDEGSLQRAILKHEQTYGIENIDYLFPDYKNITGEPVFIKRNQEWVSKFLTKVARTPFSRIKSMFANITADEARAKGYLKGNRKTEEVFSLLKRTTDPTTIYKKQKLDRDDVVDITDFNVIIWMQKEMRLMLNEEIARACIFGDGRSITSEDKIKESNVRPIISDDPFYSVPKLIGKDDTVLETMDKIIMALNDFEGSGQPTLYTNKEFLTSMKLLKDSTNRRIYNTTSDIADALGVSEIITTPILDGGIDKKFGETNAKIFGVLFNENDYNIGADKGGEINNFDDFDIDFNQYKYLMETRISAALTLPKSAIVLYKEAVLG